ncbi:ribose-phosphate diphosphokinase [Methanosarcina sp. Z-7115]|uniref:Ribose-phosphate pyrophosphokinase n=1 Tax=Methanosarcina baikalica TaxID=3073890 RepID=A0ABU2CZS8_9EURY|nr:ribose-phosphate diphosphokinase [Methanosarcina sp. Z-7115]MDR7665233.1 ribose-phosphate diphosphokinase [Methanosarcina sp. Z-7115]
MKIVGGPASQLLASRTARALGTEPVLCEFNRFPDGELYLRIAEEIENESVTLIQSTPTDSDFVSLLQLIDACEGARELNVVIPYMGYSRQDKKFKPGEPISARTVARCINADRIFTINIHEKTVLEHFPGSAYNLDAAKLLGEHIAGFGLESPILVAPDSGAEGLVKNVSSGLGFDYDHLQKTRLSGDTVVIKTKNVDVTGRSVVLVDDMIATGGTMAESIRMLRNQGAVGVYLVCVHPVLARNAALRLFNAGVKDIIGTDTLEKAESRLSVAPLIADALKGL